MRFSPLFVIASTLMQQWLRGHRSRTLGYAEIFLSVSPSTPDLSTNDHDWVGIVIEPAADLRKLRQRMINAIAPFAAE
jgi:hypothetical protein